MTILTVVLTGLEILLLAASHVMRCPSSALSSSGSVTDDVTVLPEETSVAEEESGRPLRSHRTEGFGRPESTHILELMSVPYIAGLEPD